MEIVVGGILGLLFLLVWFVAEISITLERILSEIRELKKEIRRNSSK